MYKVVLNHLIQVGTQDSLLYENNLLLENLLSWFLYKANACTLHTINWNTRYLEGKTKLGLEEAWRAQILFRPIAFCFIKHRFALIWNTESLDSGTLVPALPSGPHATESNSNSRLPRCFWR